MTNYNKATLITFFEQNDVPQGTDYANLINSQINIVETALQSMAGPLQTTELATARVSAGNGNFTGTLSVTGATTITGKTSAKSGFVLVGQTSAGDVNIAGEFIRGVVTYAAAGTAQATGTVVSAGIAILNGASDGQTTGYRLMANKTGLMQFLYNQNTVSANLWPCTGGQINVLASNAVFGMAASTMYTVIHTKASGYAVK